MTPATLLRPACSECGAGGLTWVKADDLRRLAGPAARDLDDLVRSFGSTDDPAWFCPACGGFGVLLGLGAPVPASPAPARPAERPGAPRSGVRPRRRHAGRR